MGFALDLVDGIVVLGGGDADDAGDAEDADTDGGGREHLLATLCTV